MPRSMQRFLFPALFLALLLTLLPVGRALAADYSTVKVKLSTNNATALSIYASGSYFVAENGVAFSGGTVSLRSNFDGTMTLSHSSLGDVYTGKTISLLRANMDRSAGYLQLNGYKYLGHFYFSVLSSAYLRVVNEVPLAHYLYGVVGYEMSDTFPLEALKAQAIAAKCYALSLSAGGTYDIGDTSSDQVYKGYNAGYTNVIAAVDSTLAEVLAVNGSLLTTYYAASNGGETMLPSQAWSGRNSAGYAVALDPYDLRNVYSKKETVVIPINTGGNINQGIWNLLLTKASAATGQSCTQLYNISAFALHSPRYSGQTRNMSAGSATVSAMTAGGSLVQGINVSFTTAELEAYGVTLDSSLRAFWGESSGDGTAYYLYHLRYGHGVGLSQRGAQQAASEGLGYRQILSFYYPGASLAAIAVSTPADPINIVSPSPSPSPGTSATPAPTAAAGVTAFGAVTGQGVNFRMGPGTGYASLAKLDRGTSLDIYGQENGWYQASVNGITGYIISSYVTITGYPAASDGLFFPAPSPTPTYDGIPIVSDATPSPIPSPSPSSSLYREVKTGLLNAASVNLRKGPATSYESLAKLPKDAGVFVLEQEGSWYKVLTGGLTGYVYNSYITTTGMARIDGEGNVEGAPPKGSTGLGKTTGNVYLRKGPGTKNEAVSILKAGTELTLYGLTEGWYKVKLADGAEGYVSSKYIQVTQSYTSPATITPSDTEKSMGQGVTTTDVNFRQGPSTSSKKLGRIASGSAVALYGLEGSWYRVEYNGTKGYIYDKYIKKTVDSGVSIGGNASAATPSPTAGAALPTSSSVQLAKGSAGGKVNLRKGPGTDTAVIELLAKGTQMNILGQSGDWYYVLYKGQTAFASKSYIRVESQGTAGIPQVNAGISPRVCATTAQVNMRTAANTAGSIITLLQRRAEITVYYVLNNWCLVSYGGVFGYVIADYVNLG